MSTCLPALKGWPIARTAYAIFAGRRRSCASSTIARGTTSTPIRSTLIALGYTVVTVTRGQVMDAGAFNRLAHQLAKQTGKRLRYSDPDFTRKHRALRSELLQTFALKEDAR